MRKILATLALAGALSLGLSGCIPSAPVPAETVTVTPDAPEAPQASEAPQRTLPEPAPAPESESIDRHAEFRILMGQKFGAESVDSAEIIALQWCEWLDSGMSVDAAAQTLTDLGDEYGASAHDLGYIVGAGVATFCPQHQGAMDEFVARNTA